MPHPPAPKAKPSGSGAAVRAMVSEFADEKKRERAELEAHEARRGKRGRFGLVAASALCAAAWLWPLSDPAPAPWVPASGYSQASARMTLDLAARRIHAFRTVNQQQLPRTLAQAGVREPAMGYAPAGDTSFTLRLPVGDSVLTWDSSAPTRAFEQDARLIMASTGR